MKNTGMPTGKGTRGSCRGCRRAIADGRASWCSANRVGRAQLPLEKHHACKLTDGDVATIRARAAAGESRQSLADKYGVNRVYISKLIAGRSRRAPTRHTARAGERPA